MKQKLRKSNKDIFKSILTLPQLMSTPEEPEVFFPYNNVISKETIINGKAEASEYRKMEATTFTKFYIIQENLDAILKISDGAGKLWLYILYKIPSGEHTIELNKKKIMEDLGISENTYISRVKELKEEKILGATSYSNVFMINVKRYYKGSRLRSFPNFAMERDKYNELKRRRKLNLNTDEDAY